MADDDVVHLETYSSHRDGTAIFVTCDCELGRDHTYEEWRGTAGVSFLRSVSGRLKPVGLR